MVVDADDDVAGCDAVSSVTAADGVADMLIAFIERIVGRRLFRFGLVLLCVLLLCH